MKCENCGRETGSLEVNMFNADGSDHWEEVEVFEDFGAAFLSLALSWTGDELSEEEQAETIRCPFCNRYPFKDKQIDTLHYVSVAMYPQIDRRK